MEEREDVKSMLPFLPVVLNSSGFSWPSTTLHPLEAMSQGPAHSRVDSGRALANAISRMGRDEPLSPYASQGYALFFDELMPRGDAEKWFGDVIPAMANLLLRLPALLEGHWRHADDFCPSRSGLNETGLRILNRQEAGIVILSRELIATLLACSFFSMFPITKRGSKHLPMINFDDLFATLYADYNQQQENKIKCIIHYFNRVCASIPVGVISFRRKVLHLENNPPFTPRPAVDFWSKSTVSLCHLEVHVSGLMEDYSGEAALVDFANKYLGGGALKRGCVQEEILFVIYPELIAGMLFLPSMEDNETIEIVGAERFSNYAGYASSFRFSGGYIDKSGTDCIGRHRRRIVAMDALCHPGLKQYKLMFLLREINKAFCGFCDDSKYQFDRVTDISLSGIGDGRVRGSNFPAGGKILLSEAPATSAKNGGKSNDMEVQKSHTPTQRPSDEENVGIVTGNWGCGAFGGDPELKAMIQWLAASQALRPYLLYYTFGAESLRDLQQVSQWISSQGWTVGELWDVLVEYSSQRFKQETKLGFFSWLLPSKIAYDASSMDSMDTT